MAFGVVFRYSFYSVGVVSVLIQRIVLNAFEITGSYVCLQ